MKIYLTFAFLFFSSLLEARPYEDMILLPPPKQKGIRILRNKNITYTNEQPEERGGSGLVKTLYVVKGRSRPDRTGKVLSQISGGSVVTPFKFSRDAKWIAVIVRSSGIRVWIPRASVPKIDEKFKLVQEVNKDQVED